MLPGICERVGVIYVEKCVVDSGDSLYFLHDVEGPDSGQHNVTDISVYQVYLYYILGNKRPSRPHVGRAWSSRGRWCKHINGDLAEVTGSRWKVVEGSRSKNGKLKVFVESMEVWVARWKVPISWTFLFLVFAELELLWKSRFVTNCEIEQRANDQGSWLLQKWKIKEGESTRKRRTQQHTKYISWRLTLMQCARTEWYVPKHYVKVDERTWGYIVMTEVPDKQ